jgi:hypothetical protein
MKGEKKTLIQVIHFLLIKMGELRQRYYLSKFLNQINVNDEYNGDEEIIDLMNQYRELQNDFNAVYQMLQEKRAVMPVRLVNIASQRVER